MPGKSPRSLWALTFAVHVLTAAAVYADSAEVLPKGVSRLSVTGDIYLPVDTRYDPDGDRESVTTDYNTVLDDRIFPLFLPSGENLGRSIVDFEFEFYELFISYQYGITDRLTFGLIIPYFWYKTDLKEARVDASGATYGANPLFGTSPSEPPVLPCGAGGICTDDAATGFISDALEQPPYSYEPLDTWSDHGISDVELGFRYQYLANDTWKLAFTGGVRLPTGEVDDPDNLIDAELGRGATTVLFRFQNDYNGIERVSLNGTFKYELILPEDEVLRVLDDVNIPLAPVANMEKVERDIGDIFEIEISGEYEISELFSLSLLYRFSHKGKNTVQGNTPNMDYESLEDETDLESHVYIVGARYSTLEKYLKTETGIPFDLSLSYRDRFAGKNILDSAYISLDFDIYF